MFWKLEKRDDVRTCICTRITVRNVYIGNKVGVMNVENILQVMSSMVWKSGISKAGQ